MADPHNKIFNVIQENLEQEVGTLLDEEFTLNKKKLATTTKDEFVDYVQSLSGKSVLTSIKVEDDNPSQAYILMSLRDAVRFGCILIMLPEEEIANRIKARTLEGEDADAFNEIVNIFAGVFGNSFQQTQSKKIHFKKDSVEIVSSQETKPLYQLSEENTYLQGSYSIFLGTEELSYLELLMPGNLFQSKEASKEEEKRSSQQTDSETKPLEPEGDVRLEGAERRLLTSEFSETEEEEAGPEKGTEPEIEYLDEKYVKESFRQALPETAEAVGELLGQTFSFADLSFQFISKEDYLAEKRSNWILTRFSVFGEVTGQGNFLCSLKDASCLGGTLLMMPEEEISQLSKKGDFEGELADSFGEIANIIVGTCSNIFYANYPKKVHFKREDIQALNLSKDDSRDRLADGMYYLVSGRMYLDDSVLGEAEFLISPESLGLKVPQDASSPAGKDQEKLLKKGDYQEEVLEEPLEYKEEFDQEKDRDQPLVYIIVNDDQQREIFNDCLNVFDEVSFQNVSLDSFFKKKRDKKNIYGAFLVLDKVDDYGLSYVIQVKARMESNSPLVLCGPQWTRSYVIKAIRYGAKDILVTPPEGKDIRQKFEKHIYSMIKSKRE